MKPSAAMRHVFTAASLTCDVDVFTAGDDVLLRFHDAGREQSADQIRNLVIVDAGVGYLCLKRKADAGLLSGWLRADVFSTPELVQAAISFIESLAPWARNAYVPYGIELVSSLDRVEYNGEY